MFRMKTSALDSYTSYLDSYSTYMGTGNQRAKWSDLLHYSRFGLRNLNLSIGGKTTTNVGTAENEATTT